jgi:leucyl aminopeptidase
MQVTVSEDSSTTIAGSALVVFAFEGENLSGSCQIVEEASGGLLAKLWARKEISGELGSTTLLHSVPNVLADSVLVVGLGRRSAVDEAAAFRAGGTALLQLSKGRDRERVVIDWADVPESSIASGVAGALNGCCGQDLFRQQKNIHNIQELVCCRTNSQAFEKGTTIGEGMILTRELVNLPPNYLYPESFVHRAAEVAYSCGLDFEVWDELRLRKENCNALLAVNAGSAKPPRLLILRYAGTKAGPPMALVGKGVTFDSGGLSLKPTDSMTTMKCDMAGAATVLGTMQVISKLRLATPVVGLVGLVENMVSGTSFKLGDILTARSGKTIEILNTDAEGRLVLADVLDVCLQEKPRGIIDLATLTGACMVALGTDVAGLMSNNADLTKQVVDSAKAVGELVWELPMFSLFNEQIQSRIADIKNVGEGRWGGAITAAKFLEEFVGQTPWTHLDIAGPAFLERPKSYMDAGGTACMLRTLTRLIESL